MSIEESQSIFFDNIRRLRKQRAKPWSIWQRKRSPLDMLAAAGAECLAQRKCRLSTPALAKALGCRRVWTVVLELDKRRAVCPRLAFRCPYNRSVPISFITGIHRVGGDPPISPGGRGPWCPTWAARRGGRSVRPAGRRSGGRSFFSQLEDGPPGNTSPSPRPAPRRTAFGARSPSGTAVVTGKVVDS